MVENRQANGLNISNGIGSTHTVIEIIDSDDEFEELHCNKKPTKRQKLDYSPPPQQIKVYIKVKCTIKNSVVSGAQRQSSASERGR